MEKQHDKDFSFLLLVLDRKTYDNLMLKEMTCCGESVKEVHEEVSPLNCIHTPIAG